LERVRERIMKDLYQNIKTFVQTNIPDIIHVNIWNEQITNIQDEVQFLRPALFIEFGIVEWNQVNKGKKTGTVPVILHLVTDCYDTDADDQDMMTSLELLDDVESIFDGSAVSGCTPFTSTTTQTDHNHGNLIENILSYSTQYTKCIRSNRRTVEAKPELNVQGQIKKPL